MRADTVNVASTAGSATHRLPKMWTKADRTGSYTLGRRILVTMRVHRRPQKSCSDVVRCGSLNGRLIATLMSRLVAALTTAIATSSPMYMRTEYINMRTFSFT
ncbi:hypothetical protein NL676_007578 [Syzygium grande]|nr:hypothetical protein NL676_007578 [Syzygium grande]